MYWRKLSRRAKGLGRLCRMPRASPWGGVAAAARRRVPAKLTIFTLGVLKAFKHPLHDLLPYLSCARLAFNPSLLIGAAPCFGDAREPVEFE